MYKCRLVIDFLTASLLASALSVASAAAVNLGSVSLPGSTSATVTVAVTTAGTLGGISVRTQGVENLDFSNNGGGTCTVGTSYAINATCTVSVNFAPRTAGLRAGAVVLNDNAGNVIATAFLKGTGLAPQATFLPGYETAFGPTGNSAGSCCLLVDGAGNIYVSAHGQFLKETLAGNIYTESVVSINGRSGPVAMDPAGNFYFVDSNWLYKETVTATGGYVETQITSNGPVGFASVAIDADGNVYVPTGPTGVIFKVTPFGNTYVQTPIYYCSANSDRNCAFSVAVDSAGNVFGSDPKDSSLVKLTPSGGTYGTSIIEGGFSGPSWVAVDKGDNLYVADTGHNQIVKLASSGGTYLQGTVTTGSPVSGPANIALDGSGNLYIADTNNHRYLKEDVSHPGNLIFAPTQMGTLSADSPKAITVANLGSLPLQFSARSFPLDFPESPYAVNDCTQNASLAPDESCTLSVQFLPNRIPSNDGRTVTLSETLSLTTNSFNIPGSNQTATLKGQEIRATNSMYLVTNANPVRVGSTLRLIAGVAPAASSPLPTGTVTYYSGNTTLGTVGLTNGQAILNISTLPKGIHILTATYSGDAGYTPATSNPVSEIVGLLIPTVTLATTPAAIFVGTSATLTATVAGGTNNPLPIGTITFFDGATTLGSAPLSGGVATLNFVFSVAGTRNLTAYYSGDPNYLPATSSNVVGEAVTLALSAGAATLSPGATAPVSVSIPTPTVLGSITALTLGYPNLDFTVVDGGSCAPGTFFPAGAACTVLVRFSPTSPGFHSGAVVLKDASPAANLFATVYLQGTGQAPQIGLANPPVINLGYVPIYPYSEDAYFNTYTSYGGLAFDPSGSIYVATQTNGAAKWTPKPNGSYSVSSLNVGASAASGPGIAIDGSGNLYIASGTAICKETPSPAGGYALSTIASGFTAIFGLAVDGAGNLYVVDTPAFGSGILVKESLQPDGSYLQTTITTNLGGAGAVTVDIAGTVYVSNGIGLILKEVPSGSSYIETILDASLFDPVSLALDWNGDILAADSSVFVQVFNNRRCEVDRQGPSALVTETLQPGGTYLSTLNVRYPSPDVVGFDTVGNMYVVDSFSDCFSQSGQLYKTQIDSATPPSVAFGSVLHGSTTSPQTVAFTNYGNAPLNFSAITFPAHYPSASPAAGDCAVGTPLAPGASCNVSFAFQATTPLNGTLAIPFNETITLTSDSFKRSLQTIQATGTEIASTTAAPALSLAAGIYPAAQTLTITDATPGATIYYTLDGTAPTTASTKYTATLAVAATETVSAIAVLAGNYDSPVTSAHYLIQQQAAAPVFSMPTGTYSNPVTTTITSSSPGTTIYFTINGTTPTTASAKYTGPITNQNTRTLKAISAGLPDYFASTISSATYTLAVAKPVFTPPAGTYSGTQTVTITDPTAAAHLFYTTNGSNPTGSSTQYTVPIPVSASETLKVLAIATGYTSAPVTSAAYVILPQPAPPTFSVAAGTYNNTQYVTITDSVPGATFYYTLNGTTPTTASLKYTAPVAIRNTATLKAIAVSSGYPPSAPTSATYSLAATAPVVSPAGGTYTGAQTVTITSASTSATLFYTTNGTAPSASSIKYIGPITISASETLKVIAAATGYTSSPVVTNAYIIH